MPLLTDPVDTAGLVAREVRTGSRDGAPTRIAVARRTYRTDQADLWDAMTDIDRIPRWFAPVSGDLGKGGRYQVEGNAGGVIERCDPPTGFAVTWEFGGNLSWVEVTLDQGAEGTVLELVHESPVDPDFAAQYGPRAVGVGWDLALMALGLHLSSGQAVDPDAGLAFPTTPEGVAFVRAAATGWADAAVADGDDRAEADAAADRTAAFFTTVPEGDSES